MRKAFVMLKVCESKGMAATKADCLERRQKELIEERRKMKGAVNQIVRRRCIGEEHQTCCGLPWLSL
jgi:hypothetical protein